MTLVSKFMVHRALSDKTYLLLGLLSPLRKLKLTTQLSMNFIMLINVKMPTIFGILTFVSMINKTSTRAWMGISKVA